MSKTKRRNQQKKRRKNGVLLLFVSLIMMAVASWYWFGHKEPIPVISADLLPEISDASDQRISERAPELADEIISPCRSTQKQFSKMAEVVDRSKSSILARMFIRLRSISRSMIRKK